MRGYKVYKKTTGKSFSRSYFLIILPLVLFSCVKHSNLVILKSIEKISNDSIVKNTTNSKYLIQPGDLLSIKVSSIDPSSVAIFNKETGAGRTNQVNEPSIYLTSYLVSDSGNVNIPIIGQTSLINMSITEATLFLEKKLKSYYKYVSVDIKLMSFRISILGEVSNPGMYVFFNENVNIIQALSRAGGLTDLANGKKVKIVRQVNQKLKIKVLNLRNDEVFDSEYYFLQPNDAIYIEPLKIKALKVNSPTIQLALSTLTFMIVVTNFLTQ